MKYADIKAMSSEELDSKMIETSKDLMELRFKASTKQIKNHREIPALKKDIARLKTEKRQRELENK